MQLHESVEQMFLGMQVANLGPHIREISGRSKFKVHATLTREYGKKVSAGRIDMLTYKILWGGKAHAVNLFNNGKVTFTGGYPDGSTEIADAPREILRMIGPVTNFTINNVTAQFEGNFEGRLEDIRRVLNGDIKQHFVSVSLDPFTLRLYSRGTVQLSGIRTQQQIGKAAKAVGGIVDLLERRGVVHRSVRVVVPSLTRPQNRKNLEIAPNVATRTTTCPKARRPVPYSFDGAIPEALLAEGRYYIAPNPQGQPCCYKVPQRTAYLRNKIVDRFKSLGLRIPNVTTQAFDLHIENQNKPVNVAGVRNKNMLFFNGPDGFKIGTRQAMRYSLTRLLDISRRIGVAMNARGKSAKFSKANVANAIKKWASNQGKLRVAGQAVKTNRNIRLGPRGRLAASYPKAQLAAEALKIGIRLNPAMTQKDMLEELRSKLA